MIRKLLLAGSILCVAATASWADESLWLHVKVDGKGEGGETVRINLPMNMVESALPLLEEGQFEGGRVRFDGHDMDAAEMRTLLAAVRDAEDGEYVSVQSEDETVRIAKEKGVLLVRVDESGPRGDHVDIHIRMEVVDALLSGPEDELNVAAALKLLSEKGKGELVTVTSEEETVRIWIDSRSTID